MLTEVEQPEPVLEPKRLILSLIWPDDSHLKIGAFFGPDSAVVKRIEPIKYDGGLGPCSWFAVYSATDLITEVNAAYLAMVVYAKTD